MHRIKSAPALGIGLDVTAFAILVKAGSIGKQRRGIGPTDKKWRYSIQDLPDTRT